MTVRNIKKNLAGAEDLLHGIGIESQSRGGAVYEMHKLDTYVPTYDIEEMKRSSLTFMRLYGTDTAYTDYRRNPTGTVGIPSDLGGVWEPVSSSDLPICGNFTYGAYVFSSDCVVGYNNSSMQWEGAVPKVVTLGGTPESTGGISDGAWVYRTNTKLRSELTSSVLTLVGSSFFVSGFATLRSFGCACDGTTDDTDLINTALSTALFHTIVIPSDTLALGELTIPSTSSVRCIMLMGNTLSVDSGVFNIQTTDMLIDLGGGEISLGLKYAKVSSDTSAGTVIPVDDSSMFSVGDVVSCSFDLNKLPNTTSRSTLTGGVLNTVASKTATSITMSQAFSPSTENSTIPAGAYVINGVFSKAGIYFTGDGVFEIKSGRVKDTSAGYYISVNNSNAVFRSNNVDYSGQGLDAFNFNCKDIYFDGFSFGSSFDIAKQGIVAAWTGMLSLKKGKSARSNIDADIYINSDEQMGDLDIDAVIFDGGYTGDISSSSIYGLNAFDSIVVAAQNGKLGNVSLRATKFKNFRRPAFGSGYSNKTSFSMKSFYSENVESDTNLLYFQFSDSSVYATVDGSISVNGGSITVQSDKRLNAGFRGAKYNSVKLNSGGNYPRYAYCDLVECTFAGGIHILDDDTAILGRNHIKQGSQVLLQDTQVNPAAVFVIDNFNPATYSSGTWFPLSTWLQSSNSIQPNVKVEVPDFDNNMELGSISSSYPYRFQMVRGVAASAPNYKRSRFGLMFPPYSSIKGISDHTLHKTTNARTCTVTAAQSAGATVMTVANYSQAPAVGDIFAVLYSDYTVKYHYVSAVSGAQITVSPGLYEAITTSTECALNSTTAVY